MESLATRFNRTHLALVVYAFISDEKNFYKYLSLISGKVEEYLRWAVGKSLALLRVHR